MRLCDGRDWLVSVTPQKDGASSHKLKTAKHIHFNFMENYVLKNVNLFWLFIIKSWIVR